MHSRSNISLGDGNNCSFTTTSASSFTRLAENLPQKNVRTKPSDSHIFWGTEPAENAFNKGASPKKGEDFPPLPGLSKEEIIAKHKDTSVDFGDAPTAYTSSNPCSKYFEAAPMKWTRNRKHLKGVDITHNNHETSIDETKDKIYKDAVVFGSEKVEWTTETAEQFCEQKDGLQPPIVPDSFTTNWCQGTDPMVWKTTTSSSFGIVEIPKNQATLKPGSDVCKSSVRIGDGSKLTYSTVDIFSKSYKQFDETEAHQI